MKIELRDYQQKVYERIQKEVKPYLLWMEAGTGKTSVILKLWTQKDKPLFIVTEKKYLGVWEDQIKDYSVNFENIFYLDKGKIKNTEKIINSTPNSKDVYIITYQSFLLLCEEEQVKNFVKQTMLVFDEADCFRNRKSKTTKNLTKLTKDTKKSKGIKDIFLLSATPISNVKSGSDGAEEWYSYGRIFGIDHPAFKTWTEYEREFLHIEFSLNVNSFFQKNTYTVKNFEQLMELLNPNIIRITEEQANLDLPELKVEKIEVDKDDIYDIVDKKEVFKTWKKVNTVSKFSALRTAASGFVYGENHKALTIDNVIPQKMNKLKEIIHQLLFNENKIFIYYNYDYEFEMIVKVIELYKIFKYGVKNSKRDDQGYDFNIMIMNYASGSKSLDGYQKNGFNTIIYFSPTVNGIFLKQSIKRLHRFGSTSPEVLVYHFVSKGTIEEKIYHRIINGQDYKEEDYLKDITKNVL